MVAAGAINSATGTADIISQVGYPVVKVFVRKHVARVIPAHVIGPFWRELGLAALRGRTWRVAHGFRYSTDLLVNVGCGPNGKPGWVNLDADLRAHVNRRLDPYPALTARYDCRRRLPFPDGSVKAVFTEHFLEHLHYEEELPTFLRETHRVLQAGGILRIVVPDAEKYVLAYPQGWGALARLRSVDHYRSRMEVVNDVFREAGLHKFAYDFETLEEALMRARFSTVVQQQFGTSLLNELAIDLEHRQAESLYVEAVK
jgi:predicted SAM-dependent methyltransferase